MTKERWLHGFRRIGETVSKMKISPGRDRNREGETSDGEKYGTSGSKIVEETIMQIVGER